MRIFKIIIDLLVGLALAGLGVYLLLRHHPAAGGWTLFFGILALGYATSESPNPGSRR